MIDAKRIGDRGLARPGKRIEFARRESANLTICRGVVVGRALAFSGRASERATLDRVLNRVRDGESAVLVMRGEAGIGKTALMQYCVRQASDCRVAQISGVESEVGMPLAGLHQLCGPMLGELDSLPEPQQQALRVAFGRWNGDFWPTPALGS